MDATNWMEECPQFRHFETVWLDADEESFWREMIEKLAPNSNSYVNNAPKIFEVFEAHPFGCARTGTSAAWTERVAKQGLEGVL